MRPLCLAFAACCIAATTTHAAGLRLIEVPADAEGPVLTGAVWTPCAEPAQEVMLGKRTVRGVRDCPIVGDKLPLIVVSHGRLGSVAGHHDTAETLADAGFVVAAVNHPGDSALDPSRSGDLSVFLERPDDMKRLVDFMLGAWPDAAKIDRRRIGFFGFSRGGYTGLVLIGGNPDFRCPEGSTLRLCTQIRHENISPDSLTHDPRIKAAILADPLFAALFAPDRLTDVTIPVQLWGSALGGDGVAPDSIAALAQRLLAKTDFRVVENAGHFAFLAPCPAALAKEAAEICTDPPGFDRAAFHKTFDADMLAFFRGHLVDAETP